MVLIMCMLLNLFYELVSIRKNIERTGESMEKMIIELKTIQFVLENQND